MPPVKVDTSPEVDVVSAIEVVQIMPSAADEIVEYKPEMVWVRAMARGYYGARKVVEDFNGNRTIERDALIRNVGDVFQMDTGDMRRLPLGAAPKDALTKKEFAHSTEHGYIEIKTPRGHFELPSWVTLEQASSSDAKRPTGHQTSFGKKDGQLIPNPS